VDYIFRLDGVEVPAAGSAAAAGEQPRQAVSSTANVTETVTKSVSVETRDRAGAAGEDEVGVRRHAVCAPPCSMRLDHGAQRVLLQVQQLRHDQRLRVATAGTGPREGTGPIT
jgi:hypothetical protein